MENEVIKFFQIERQIFGICSDCGEIFRLSDCKIFMRKKGANDWFNQLFQKNQRKMSYCRNKS